MIGQEFLFDGGTATVIGVAPEAFRLYPGSGDTSMAGTGDPDLWLTQRWSKSAIEQDWFRRAHFVHAIARLAKGVSPEVAQAELEAVATQLQTEHPVLNQDMGAGITSLHPWVTLKGRAPLLLLFAAVAAMLLVALANVVGLVLVRLLERSPEWSLRRALGARSHTLLRQQALEGVLIAVPATALAATMATATLTALRRWAPAELPRVDTLHVSAADALVVSAAALVLSVLTFVVPAVPLMARRAAGKRPGLLRASPRSDQSPGLSGSTRFLIAAEIAMALTLVVVVFSLGRSLMELQRVETGFEPAGVLTATVALHHSDFDREMRIQKLEGLLEQSRALPGVEAAGAVSSLPLADPSWTFNLSVENLGEEGHVAEVRHMTVDTEYFTAAGVAVLSGRGFEPQDSARLADLSAERAAAANQDPPATERRLDDPRRVAVVNQVFADSFLTEGDPIGQRVKSGRPDEDNPWMTVIGVVENEAQDALDQEVLPQLYELYRVEAGQEMTLVLRTNTDPLQVADAFREMTTSFDSRLRVLELRSHESVVNQSLAKERFLASTTAALALIALFFAALGVHATLAYWVSRRRHEMGIRHALGAETRDLVRLVLSEGLRPVFWGLLAGLALALGLARATRALWSELLFKTTPWDPVALGLVLAVLAGVALVACLGPAIRASRVDPQETLRAE